jgi:uncharacterized radical SAM protein YgiQ
VKKLYPEFLSVCKDDFKVKGFEQPDFILVSADAYIDHPAFAPALLGRYLEHLGFAVGIIAQPYWQDTKDFIKLGQPKYAFLVCPGTMDGMVSAYTVNKRKRSEDVYSPGGKAGLKPERPCLVYTSKLKQAYPDVPVIIGGMEASLRRFAHYDYWDNAVRRSILFDSKADLLVYGMGELPLKEIAERFREGKNLGDMHNIRGICYFSDKTESKDAITLPSFEQVRDDKKAYAACFRMQYNEQEYLNARTLIQKHGDKYLMQNPPMRPMTTAELDVIYELPYTREQHPMYGRKVPALEEVKFSLVANRGCFGGCSFCSIRFHQGLHVQKRSKQSLLREALKLTAMKDFKGYIHDVGGPTANFTHAPCEKFKNKGCCKEKSCLSPEKCPNLKASHAEYLEILRSLRKLPSVKKVFIRSGIRFDYLMYDANDSFFNELVKYHISGQLKVAPEHVSDSVLAVMRKPVSSVYRQFAARFKSLNEKYKLKQYLVPYFISSHPGSTLKDAIELAEYLRDMRFSPEQVQDFYPTPGTLSTCMYYTGIHPLTGKSIYVPRTMDEKSMQRALLQFRKPENYAMVKQALLKEDRADLIGFHTKALIPPRETRPKK